MKQIKSKSELDSALPKFRKAARSVQEMLLSNLVMIGEIPSPTFGEAERVQFLQHRFSEFGLQNCSSDEMGNALGILPGKSPSTKKNILLVAHTDTVFPANSDHTISVLADRVCGPGLADDGLGLATLVTLPSLLENLGIQLRSNLILMGSSRSLGRGNLEGLRFFLENNDMPITAGICVEGAQLGRLSIASIGMARGEIHCGVSQSYDWTRFGTTNAILTMNEIINRIMEIPMPLRPRSSIVLGTIEGGKDFNTLARSSKLGFEIRSENGAVVQRIEQHLDDIVAEVGSQTESDVSLEIFARRSPGGLSFGHPLARETRQIMQTLRIPQRAFPSTSELSAFIDRGIPAITIGISTCESLNEKTEEVFIEPMFAGLAQLVGIILAVDGGWSNDG